MTQGSTLKVPALLVAWLVVSSALAADPQGSAPGSQSPIPRIIPHGPATLVQAIAFANGGQTLYAGGWDKVVCRWDLVGNQWELVEDGFLTIPIGGGLDGAIQALVVSPDGDWIAVGGRGTKRGVAGSQESGFDQDVAYLSVEQRLDEGTIYLFHKPTGRVSLLRGHQGGIISLHFPDSGDPVLVSVAEVWDASLGEFQMELIAWDVPQQREMGRLNSYLVGQQTKSLPAWDGLLTSPGVCVFGDAEQPMVGIAWADAKREFGLRIWDIQKQTVELLDSSRMVFDVDVDPVQENDLLFACADLSNGQGEIRRLPGGTKSGGAEAGSQLVHQFGVKQIPMAMKLVSNDGKLTGAAVVRNWDSGKSVLTPWRLENSHLVSGDSFAVANIDLPIAIAAESLAWCNPQDNAIRVQTKGETRSIRSESFAFTHVKFVGNDGDLGLRLGGAREVDLLLDIKTQTLKTVEDNPKDFELSDNASGNVDADGNLQIKTEVSGKSYQVTIPNPGNKFVPIEPGYEAKGILIGNRPVLVVAYNHLAQPYLELHDLTSGKLYRKYSAHSGRILDLSVSTNQKLMATTSTDGTVRLWWLGEAQAADLKGAFQHGLRLSQDSPGRVRVTRSADTLKSGDIISEIDFGTGSREVTSPQDCYFWAAKQTPGTKVTLTTQRGPQVVELGTAVKWERELLAIAFRRSDEDWDWLAWHPSGAYAHRGDGIESWLQWHFNTGDPKRPAQMSHLQQYDEEFSRGDFLLPLLETGKLPPRPIPNPPTVSMLLLKSDHQVMEPGDRGYVFARHRSDLSKVVVRIEDFPTERIEQVRYSLMDSTHQVVREGIAESGSKSEWVFLLNDIAWSSGFFLLAAEPVIDGKPHPNWGVSTDIRFQPPAPNIKIGQVADVTQQPVVTIPLQIQCDVACRVGVSVSTKGNEEKPEIVHWDVVPGEHNLEAQINLAIGFNQIEVTAENQDPLLRFENVERSRLTFPLIRTELNRPALQANVQQVSLRSANSQAGLSREQLRAQPVVDEALWNLAVKVESSQEIKCSYQLNDQLLEMRHSDDFWIADLKLNPGANHIEILAFNGNEKKLLESIDVRFQPAVPNIGLLTVSRTALNDEYADQWLNGTIVDGIHESELQLACPLQTTVDGIYPYLAQMLVDGTPVPEVELQRNDQQLSARWVPPQGRHRVQFRVSNQWGSEQLTAAVSVERVSPPEISKLVAVNPTPEQAIVQTSFEVSPSASFPIEPGLFRASVNGELVPLSNRVKIDGNRVDLLVPGQPGTNNEVQIWMESDERVLVAPSSVNVDVPQLRGKLPEIDFDVVTETSHQRVPVGLRILSESQLARLEVGLALGKLQPILENEWVQRDGYIEVLAERNLMFLQPGVNTIFVVAENQSGTTTEQQIVTFVPKPVSLGSMYFASKPTQTIDFSREDRYLGSVDTSQQELDVILELDADSVGAKNRVQVWVNGFLQASAPLTSDRDGAAHRLKAFVTLTRPQGNTIELEFAQGIKSATNLRRSFTVDCLEPSVEQELFVVILDATSPEDDSKTRTTELQNRLQEAVLAYERKGRLISDTFQVINFEHVMYGEMLELRDIKGRLSALRLAISQRQETAKISPVVLMYYRGHEQVFPDDQGERQFGLYTAASSRIDDEQARVETLLTSREIRERFAEMGGAHLLVLDLDANDSKNNPWPVADPYLGVFRFVRDEEQSESVLSELQRELPEAQVLVRLKQQMQDSILKRRVGFPDFHVPRALEQLRLGLGSKNLTAE